MKSFYEKNIDLVKYIQDLERTTGKKILEKLKKEKNEINFLSTISEFQFGKYLSDKFKSNLKYEQEIFNKRPDWLIEINNDKLIFEVLRINLPNEELQQKIDCYKNDSYSIPLSGTFFGPGRLNRNDFEKILKKQQKYKELIDLHQFKLIICIDTSDWDKKIDVLDIKCSLDFDNPNSDIFQYEEFTKSVSGLIVKPYFGKTEFIHNKNAKSKLNAVNLDVLKS